MLVIKGLIFGGGDLYLGGGLTFGILLYLTNSPKSLFCFMKMSIIPVHKHPQLMQSILMIDKRAEIDKQIKHTNIIARTPPS